MEPRIQDQGVGSSNPISSIFRPSARCEVGHQFLTRAPHPRLSHFTPILGVLQGPNESCKLSQALDNKALNPVGTWDRWTVGSTYPIRVDEAPVEQVSLGGYDPCISDLDARRH